jgi:hypothetical protein
METERRDLGKVDLWRRHLWISNVTLFPTIEFMDWLNIQPYISDHIEQR